MKKTTDAKNNCDIFHSNSMINKKPTDKLDVPTSTFLREFSKNFSSIKHFSLPEQRATIKELFRVPITQLESVAHIEDKIINGKNGSISIRLFSPKNKGPLPVIVYFHRGGWVYGSIEESEMICRRLANLTGCIVAAVEYHLAPEYKFPIPLEDCYDATCWISQNSSTFKVSGNPNKLILCGESAGGNLAAAVAIMVRDKKELSVAGQLLIYPVLSSFLDPNHYDESPDKSLLSFENMQFFLGSYLSSSEEKSHPYAFPLNCKNHEELPACFILTAEHDALKHEGKRYAEDLHKAGIKVLTKCYPEVIHGFLDLPLSEAIKEEAFDDIALWIKNL